MRFDTMIEHTHVAHVFQVMILLMNSDNIYNLSEVEFEEIITEGGLIIVTLIS